jgi:MFS family permease
MILSKFGEYGIATSLILWGFSFGIGFPSCLALMPILSRVEERGRIGGIIFFTTYAILPLFVSTIGRLDIVSSSFLLAIWRCFSLFLFLFKIDVDTPPKPVSYSSLFSRRQFLLYFLPFLIFCLINELERPIFKESLGMSFWETLMIVEYSVGSLMCLISGWLIDFKGRRWTVLAGFVTLGLGYAVLGFFPFTSVAQAFFVFADSTAWGVFTVVFGLVIWGDIANHQQAEKFYGLGSAPSPFALTLAMLASPLLKTLDVGKAFPLASFFLFLAVIPIFFAPELLPEKVVKERELRKYMEEVKKVAGRG